MRRGVRSRPVRDAVASLNEETPAQWQVAKHGETHRGVYSIHGPGCGIFSIESLYSLHRLSFDDVRRRCFLAYNQMEPSANYGLNPGLAAYEDASRFRIAAYVGDTSKYHRPHAKCSLSVRECMASQKYRNSFGNSISRSLT